MTVFPLGGLGATLRDLGARFVLVKRLAPNNNSKNQIYIAQDIAEVSLLNPGEVEYRPGSSKKREDSLGSPIFHAPLNWWWLTAGGTLANAPDAKLVLHPQYGKAGEVRLSGFLKGCREAPSDLLVKEKQGTAEGRVLLLAPLEDGRLVAAAFGPDTPEARALHSTDGEGYGVFHRYELDGVHFGDSEAELLAELYRIHEMGWLAPEYLEADGSRKPCKGTNCGGVTLETHLGIRANGSAEPDFQGWEVKQHGVKSLDRPRASTITLFTPEPTGGRYVSDGPEYFIRRWGYPDRGGSEDRINFGGIYKATKTFHPTTGLRLALAGFEPDSGKLMGHGAIVLLDSADEVAASWSFAKLMSHWKNKHAKAVFVPSELSSSPVRYRYGVDVKLGDGTSFGRVLQAFHAGLVFYDPGLKLEGASSPKPKAKRRSQFRVRSADLYSLYDRFRDARAAPLEDTRPLVSSRLPRL